MKKNTLVTVSALSMSAVLAFSLSVQASPVRGSRSAQKLPTEVKPRSSANDTGEFTRTAPQPKNPSYRPAATPKPVAGQPVFAEPIESDDAGASQNSPVYESVSRSVPDKRVTGLWLFLGADAGMSFFSTFNSATTEASRSGIHLGVRGLLAYYWPKWVIDGGLGWQFFQNSATYPSGDKIKVTTRAGYLDLSGRYRFPKSRWQLGPELQYWLSTDQGLNTSVFDTTSNTSIWGGLQGVNEWSGESNQYRLGARWLTDLNVSGRTAHVIQIFFQIGFNLAGGEAAREERPRRYEQISEGDLEKASTYTAPSDPLPIATPEPEATPWKELLPMSTPEPTPEVTPAPKPVAKEKLVMTLDVNDLPFDFDSARLPRYNMDRVREIGRFLGEHKNAWRSLTVAGHTDERGTGDYNNKLSKARADTVRQLLGEGGAPIKRIRSIGWGERKPKNRGHDEKAWSQNRRVELEFQGVKDVQIIKGAFDTQRTETR